MTRPVVTLDLDLGMLQHAVPGEVYSLAGSGTMVVYVVLNDMLAEVLHYENEDWQELTVKTEVRS